MAITPETYRYYTQKDNKIAVITGGNQGIGFYTVLHLILHGFHVYMLGRDEERCSKAIKDIETEADKRIAKYTEEEKNSRYLGKIDYIKCDLTDLKSVQAAADEIKKSLTKIDLLINNAGILGQPYIITKDNIEIQYQTNVTSHVLLDVNLLPLLDKLDDPRFITVSSKAHELGEIREDTMGLQGIPDSFYSFRRYAITKLANVHMANYIAKLKPNVLSVAVHPGVVNTDIYANTFSNLIVKAIAQVLMFNRFTAVSTEVGSYSTLRAALDDKLEHKDEVTYIGAAGNMSSATAKGKNPEYSKNTWNSNLKKLTDRGFKIEW